MAQMRLAYTRATVAFPRTLNMTPITLMLRDIFAAVYQDYQRGRKNGFDPFEEVVISKISSMVDQAREEILLRTVAAEMTRGMSSQEARKVSGIVAGLERDTAAELIRCIKTGQNWIQKRATFLATRRNRLANDLVRKAIREASSYYEGRGSVKPRAV